MDILSIAIIIFCVLEAINVIILYKIPDTQVGNGMGVFDEWHKSKEEVEQHFFVKYLVNWVANAKLIFIVLLQVVLWTGTESTRMWATVAMIISISIYFVTLHPLICKLDKMGKITPKNYSKGLGAMIASFLIMFLGALIIYLI